MVDAVRILKFGILRNSGCLIGRPITAVLTAYQFFRQPFLARLRVLWAWLVQFSPQAPTPYPPSFLDGASNIKHQTSTSEVMTWTENIRTDTAAFIIHTQDITKHNYFSCTLETPKTPHIKNQRLFLVYKAPF